MKPFSPRPVFTLAFFATSNQKIIRNSQFAAFSTQISHTRRHEDESRGVRVSVWWDFENCHVPITVNAFRVAQSITNAVRAKGIKGPIQITAFGDVMQISRSNQEALSSTGINLTHVPCGGKNSADRSLLVDLMYWVSQNPPPAHVFLISGDRDFAGILHRLRMNNYNILLASPDSAPSVLCCAATVMWQWSALLKGDNLSGKHFNQPPDGPYSWYGHFKAPLEDPFEVMSQSSGPVANKPCDEALDSKVELVPMEDKSCNESPDAKFRPIPEIVVNCIRRILRSYPQGVILSVLRDEIKNSNLALDKDLYGYKKFSHFLSAMPHVLELHPQSDRSIIARSVNTKYCDEYGKSPSDDVTDKSTPALTQAPKVKAESTNSQKTGKEQKQKESSLSMKMQTANLQNPKKEENKKVSSPKSTKQDLGKPEKVEVGPTVVATEDSSGKNENQQDLKPQKVGAGPTVFVTNDSSVKIENQQDFAKPEKVEAGPEVAKTKDSSVKSENEVAVLDESNSGFGIFRKIWMVVFGSGDAKRNDAKSFPALFSPSSHEAMLDKKIVSDISVHNSGDIPSREPDNKIQKDGEISDQFEVNSKPLEIFAQESFWKEMELFINSTTGSALIVKSRARENLAQNLRKQGPPVLRTLSETDLLHLVDLLISDKKWIAESDGRIFRFKLTRSSGEDSPINHPLTRNGLSHIFSANPIKQEPGEKKLQNPPHTGVPQSILHRGSLTKGRNELLADCKKLVDQIVKEYPEGFNIGGFRKRFLENYGYALDVQKLGYDKLVNLLQIMPGVRVESNLILPGDSLKNLDLQDINFSTQENKVRPVSDDSEHWDELGPIENRTKQKGITEFDYERVKEDDWSYSDSDEEPPPTRSEKRKPDEEESSLMDILDSWFADGTDNSGTASATDSEGIVSRPSQNIKKQMSAVVEPRKPKTGKSYSFVSEQPFEKRDKLVEGILGSLKKPSDKSADCKVLS